MKKIFDYIIITVSNQYQKEIIKEQIEKRKKVLPEETQIKIIIETEKIGSGGALLRIIHQIETKNKKILLINSAGESKRIVLYADKGKICTPTFDKPDSIVFDEIIEETAEIGRKMDSGILIVSGDCTTIYKKIKSNYITNNTAISVLAPASTGERHGVFVTENGVIKKTLQKEKIDILQKENAVNADGQVKIDTGTIYYNEETINKLKEVKFGNDIIVNLYTDLMYPLSTEAQEDEYLNSKAEGKLTQELIELRKNIWNQIHNCTVNIEEIEDGKFIHYGTVSEFIKIAFKKTKAENIIINSTIYGKLTKRCYIENSCIYPQTTIGENSIIIDSTVTCDIPEDLIIKTIKIGEQYATIILGINDNIKENNIDKLRLFSEPIGEFLKRNNLLNEENCTLWDCKIYTICDTKEEAVLKALELYKKVKEESINK